MSKLQTDPRIPDPDRFYQALAELHAVAETDESLLMNSKLIFLLANHIGDQDVIMEAIEQVKANTPDVAARL